jgi:crotonobetainyl-CoA:carnitine CoA-transferase CaiB-like acyl-CoA transferase
LRQHGATVSKVEPPSGDPLRTFCSPWYLELHQGVQIERLDLKSDAGRARVRVLLADADLFIASHRPSALSRLGLDADTLLADGAPFRRLRCLNIVGEADRPEMPGHDLTYLGRAGLLGAELPRTLLADVFGGERGFAAALLLLARPAGASDQLGLYDSLAPLAAPLRHGLTRPGGVLGGGLPAYGTYATQEGRLAVAALEPHFSARLYEALGLPKNSELTTAFKSRTAKEWEAWAVDHDLPIIAIVD